MAFTIRPSCRVSVQGVAGFCFLLTLLVLSREPTDADWVAVESTYQTPKLKIVYVDPDTIRRNGDLVVLWQLTDFQWKQGSIVGRRFLSTKTHKQFDCATQRVRVLAFTDFVSHMATGSPADGYVDKDHWLPVIPESINHALWEVACQKA